MKLPIDQMIYVVESEGGCEISRDGKCAVLSEAGEELARVTVDQSIPEDDLERLIHMTVKTYKEWFSYGEDRLKWDLLTYLGWALPEPEEPSTEIVHVEAQWMINRARAQGATAGRRSVSLTLCSLIGASQIEPT